MNLIPTKLFVDTDKSSHAKLTEPALVSVNEETIKPFPKFAVFIEFIRAVTDGTLTADQINVYRQKLAQLNITTGARIYLDGLFNRPEEKLSKYIIWYLAQFKKSFPEDYELMATQGGFCCGSSEPQTNYDDMTADRIWEVMQTLEYELGRAEDYHQNYSSSLNHADWANETQHQMVRDGVEKYQQRMNELRSELERAREVWERKK
ncbi:MAG: hypothetical protein OHK0017_11850 [Patescibacteria group bacterium]